MYHVLLIHSSINGHLGCFQVLIVANNAAMNMGRTKVSSGLSFWFLGWMPRSKLELDCISIFHLELYLCIIIVCLRCTVSVMVLMWRSKNNSWKSVFSFLPGFQGFQGLNLGLQAWWQVLYDTEPSQQPSNFSFLKNGHTVLPSGYTSLFFHSSL